MMKRSKKLDVAKNMPPRYHKLPDKEYSTMNSLAIDWLVSQPEIREYVWDHLKQSGLIRYDEVTGKWSGVNGSDKS